MSAPACSNGDLIAAIQAQTNNQAQWNQAIHATLIDLAARMDRHHDLPEQTRVEVLNANTPVKLHRAGRRYLRIYNPNSALTCTLNIPGLPPVTAYSLPANWSTLNVPDDTTILGPSGNNNILVQPVDWEPGDESASSSGGGGGAVTIASGAVSSGAYAAGSIASGAVSSGAFASGALAAGSIASGAAVSGAFADGAIATIGTEADAAWGGSGSGTLIAIQKKIESLLAGTLTVSSAAPINPTPSGATAKILTTNSVAYSTSAPTFTDALANASWTGPATGKTFYLSALTFSTHAWSSSAYGRFSITDVNSNYIVQVSLSDANGDATVVVTYPFPLQIKNALGAFAFAMSNNSSSGSYTITMIGYEG